MQLSSTGRTSVTNIEALVREFEACTLPASAWTHAAHLSVAVWYLRHHSRDEATRLLRAGIQRYNASNGRGLSYHETITLAWVEILSRFLADQDVGQPWPELLDLVRDRFGDPHYLLRFYDRDDLFSAAARQGWHSPSRPFDVLSGTTPES